MQPPFRTDTSYHGLRVTVMGLGLFGGGAAAAGYFLDRGAQVTVTDLKSPQRLALSLAELKPRENLRLVLGKHREEDFVDVDVVIVNPAVPKNSPYLAAAGRAGVRLETETNIVVANCAAPIVGITGSNGKTTTATLVFEMLRRGPRRVWLGGNIGKPLIERLDEIKPDDIVVMELSSFQLEDLHSIGISPGVSVVTNLAPNHLDRHNTMEEYASAKKAIVAYQSASDLAVLNYDDAAVRSWAGECAGEVAFFSLHAGIERGAYLSGGVLYLRDGEDVSVLCDRCEINLPGDINVANILAASVAASRLGALPERICSAVREFHGVEHRLELFLERGGVSYFNDSIATTAESATAALNSVPRPIVLVAGGYDKKIPLGGFAGAIAANCDCVVLLGETAESLKSGIEAKMAGDVPRIIMAGDSFEDAVRFAVEAGVPGGSVLLSPGTASYDMFENFAQRGAAFKELVGRSARRR